MGGEGEGRGYRRQNRRLYWISFGAEMKKRKSRRKKGSLILTKVAISGADVIEHERETKSLSFCISRRLPLILISSSSFLLLFFFFIHEKRDLRFARDPLPFSFSFLSLSLSLFCLSLLLSSASLPPPSLSIYFSLFEAVVRVTSNVNQSVGIVASFLRQRFSVRPRRH